MLKQIWLDDSSYDDIYEKAVEKLQRQAPWWTHTEVSDSGIMLLEMWAVLTDMQSYYLNQVQESHYRKYLKLLGIPSDEGECARAWIFFDNVERECVVPEGTKLLADRMVFETETEVRLTANRLTGFYQNTDVNRVKAMQVYRKTKFPLQEGGEKLFSFVIKEQIQPGEEFLFFLLLDEQERRNWAAPDFHMVQLAWEYETSCGWREAQVVRDETGGLLFSGCICLCMDMPMAEGKEGYEIRCRMKEGTYDLVPSLYKICLNVVRAVQKDTLCCEETADFSQNCHRVLLKSYLARTGNLRILKKVEGRGEFWEDITDSPEIVLDPPVTEYCMERSLVYAGEGHVKIVCTAACGCPDDFAREVTGIAAQQIALPWEKVLRSSVKLMLLQEGGEGNVYRTWRREEPEEDRYDNAWHWKEEENVIVLGDGRHGDIPEPSKDGLLITSLALWEGEKGNVSIDKIVRWERPELFRQITCTNRMTGWGGRDRLLPSRQFEQVRADLLRPGRMITEADIQALAMETPGLLLKEVKAEWRDGVVWVKVVPAYPLKNSYCVERYQSQVENYLEPYRLAGTRIHIEIAGQSG